MRRSRFLLTLCCAFAVAAVLAVPGVRADEYTKLTYLTFSGPVQVPGVTLPAGTYMFKLADPSGGRRAIQIWDEKGTKIYTTLLTIPDEQPEAKADPVVLFSERPSGSPHAVKSWFYPAERTGYEFIYPKSQAVKIAADANTSVLAYNDDPKSDADENTLRGAQIGRVDGQGQVAADTASTTTTARADTPAAAAPQNDPAPRAQTAPAASPSTSPTTSANRTAPTAPAPATTAPSTTASARTTTAERAVGTSGSQGATAAQSELPRTASPLAAMQLMSLTLIAGGLGVRQMRRRYARNK
jgi:hypothetical protein